ncbi:MAG: hypothetical protein EP329_22995 [Deltaproteobacteria bacterium]|nr:MAG: hypothetical protein EP329_22995 [Deltaproteobacteria bacterium]
MAVHPTGALVAVATGDVDSTVTIARWSDLAPVGRVAIENVVYTLAFSGDGRRLALASRSGELSLWDLTGRRALARAAAPLDRFDQLVAHVAFGPAGATFLTHGGDAHHLGDDGAVALDALALGGTAAPSPGGGFVAVHVDRFRARLAGLPGGDPIRDVLADGHDAAALLPDGRLVTLAGDTRAIVAHPCPEAIDPAPPAVSVALAPIGPDDGWVRVDAPAPPVGLSGVAAHHWRTLRKTLVARAAELGLGQAQVDDRVERFLPRVARVLVAADVLVRALALFELGRGFTVGGGEAGVPRGARLAETLAHRLPDVGRLLAAVAPSDLDWTDAEWDLVGAVTAPDDWQGLAVIVADLAEQLAFEGALCARRDAAPGSRSSTVAALRAAEALPEALGVVASDLGGVAPASADALLALAADETASFEARSCAALVLELREEGPGALPAVVSAEIRDLLGETEALFAWRRFAAGLDRT